MLFPSHDLMDLKKYESKPSLIRQYIYNLMLDHPIEQKLNGKQHMVDLKKISAKYKTPNVRITEEYIRKDKDMMAKLGYPCIVLK